MEKYEAMRDSGHVWLGQIPKHWKMLRMKNVFEVVSERNHPDAEVLSLYREYGVLPKSSRDDNHNVTSEDTTSYKFVHVDDLVINKMKAWQGSLGISQYEGIVSPAYYVCRFINDDASKRYYHYLLRSRTYAQEFERLSTGMRVGQWDLGIDDFLSVPALIPPLDEQYAIAAYLDDQVAQINSIIAEAQASIEEYKQWKASVIFEIVTKGLDATTAMRRSSNPGIGMIPAHWKEAKVKQVAQINPSCPVGNLTLNDEVSFAPMECIRADRRLPKTASLASNNSSYSSFLDGDIALAKVTPCFQNSNVCIMENLVNGYAFGSSELFNIRPTSVNRRFLLYYFMTETFKDGGVASMTGVAGLQRVSSSYVRNAVLPYPNAREQAAIVNYLDEKCRIIDGITEEKESLIADLESYKRSLIYEAVTGKRKVV